MKMRGDRGAFLRLRRVLQLAFATLPMFLASLSCETDESQSRSTLPVVQKGVAISPRSYDAAGFEEFLDLSRETGELIMWAGDWLELADSTAAPDVIAALAPTYGCRPMIVAQFFSQSGDTLLRPLSDSVRTLYVEAAVRFAVKFRPPFMGFGIEVNMLFDSSPADFDTFATLFSEVCDSVHARSPATKVFTVFQLEKMKGLNGGLFGGVNDSSDVRWILTERFPCADLVVFTTYPGLIYADPHAIPEDYFQVIRSHVSKPVAVSETGWHSDSSISGWESNEEEEAEFARTLGNLITPANPTFVIWSFMFDPETSPPFNSMGLRRRTDGQPKAAWSAWQDAFR